MLRSNIKKKQTDREPVSTCPLHYYRHQLKKTFTCNDVDLTVGNTR